jgi:cholesterol transport system auxiliary component
MTGRRQILVVALLLSSCAARQPAPQERFFVLDPAVIATAGGAASHATLLVNDLAARGFIGGRQIVFRTHERPLEVSRYTRYLWEEPPGRALARELVAAIRAAGLFEFVLTPAERARSDYALSGELSRFEHLPTASPPRVAVAFTLTLMRGADRRLLLTKSYSGEERTNAPNAEAMVYAFNRLTARLLSRAVEDLRSVRLHSRRPSSP